MVSGTAPRTGIWIWLAALLLIVALRAIDVLAGRRRRTREGWDGRAEIRRFGYGVVATAIAWTAMPVLFFHEFNQVERTTLAIIVSAMAGGAATVLAASRWLAIGYCAALLLPSSIMFLLTPSRENMFLGFLGIIFFVVISVGSTITHRATMSAIRLNRANETLVFEMERERERIVEARARLQTVVDGVADALISLDRHGHITAVNPAACKLFERPESALLGIRVSMILLGAADVAGRRPGDTFEVLGQTERGTVPLEVRVGDGVLIARDISARKQIENATRAALDAAIYTADVKARILATMSHEIRTPLNAIVGLSEMLVEDGVSGEALSHANTLHDAANTLLALINGVLDFSKIEAGKIEFEATAFEPRVMLEGALAMLDTLAAQKDNVLQLDVAADVPQWLIGDPDRVRQILTNLISNAIKFTTEGTITISARMCGTGTDPALVRYAVTDTGIGIDRDAASRLFTPFAQADASTQRRFGGTGLGLSISKRLVELMHGEIGFESNPGHGSTFWFQLPHALAGEAAASESAKTAVPPPLPPGLRVLVADDNPVNRMLAERQLAKLGCSAVAVDSGPEAIAALTGHTFDIVLMDCLMPGMSGFETARAIRAREAAHDRPRIPVVALTASVLEEDRKAVAASGMDGYLAKPVTLDRLRSMLAQHARPPQRQAAGPTAGPATVESQS